MANISRNTYDKLKHYVNVRMQQGVPLVDADWNEKDDIRKNELQIFLKWFIGNGIPRGNDGFHILPQAGGENDFLIKGGTGDQPGICLVEGWDVRSETDIAYKAQPLFNNDTLAQAWGVTAPAALTLPASGTRTDLVYLDAWEREVNAIEDPALKNPAINIETCVRIKREWVVRVAEGAAVLPATVPVGHVFYALAAITRQASQPIIAAADIIDLRATALDFKTDLSPITLKNNNVGIGTADPQKKLHVNGGSLFEGQQNHFKDAENKGRVRVGAAWGIPGIFSEDAEDIVMGMTIGKKAFIGTDPNFLTVLSNGSVGIGNQNPSAKVVIQQGATNPGTVSNGKTFFVTGPYGSGNAGDGGIEFRHDNLTQGIGFGYNSIYATGTTANQTLNLISKGTGQLTLNAYDGGNVGIGTTAPAAKLEVNGNVNITQPGAISFGATTRQMINLWQTVYGIGIQDSTQYYRTGLNFAWHQGGIHDNGALNPGTGGTTVMVIKSGNVGIGTTAPGARLHVNGGAIMPAAGNSEAAGILFPKDAYGGSGDRAYMRYYARSGEATSLEIANYNDPDDHIALMTNGGVGIGTNDPGGDKLDVRGKCYSSGGWTTYNADYAEYFESESGEAIPAGTAVIITTEGTIRPAKEGESPIGVISINPSVVGNVPKEWPGKYLRDEWGKLIIEEYKVETMAPKKETIKRERQKVEIKTVTEEISKIETVLEDGKYRQKTITETVSSEMHVPLFQEVDLYDESGEEIIGKHQIPVMETYEEEITVMDEHENQVMVGSGEFETKTGPKLNPDYDESKEYITRDQRPDWNCVGLLGQLRLGKGQPTAPTWTKIKDITETVELWLVK